MVGVPLGNKVKLTVSVSVAATEHVERLMEEYGINQSAVIERLVEYYVGLDRVHKRITDCLEKNPSELLELGLDPDIAYEEATEESDELLRGGLLGRIPKMYTRKQVLHFTKREQACSL